MPGNAQAWLLFGLSFVYLAHYASLYTQLPGLFGQSGLAPIVARAGDVASCWLLPFFSSPELGLEVMSVAGLALSVAQVCFSGLREGSPGVAAFTLQWLLWHDLVIAGGRFTAYQMDVLMLDAAPLSVLAASGACAGAVTFGFRWLFLRLYLGGGAVKLLSCDESWRNLSALHWHFQSQPLPNSIGSVAHLSLPSAASEFSTLSALLLEIGLPFLFLAASSEVRRPAFALQAVLQAGIALAGNFGPFNALTVLLGLCLLEDGDLPAAPGCRDTRRDEAMLLPTEAVPVATASAIALAVCACFWTLWNVASPCSATIGPSLLVWAAILLSPLGIASCVRTLPEALLAALLLLGSVSKFSLGLGVLLPMPRALLANLNLGAASYGLFARMTGVGGRPTEVLEVAAEAAGPWFTVPFRYQVMEPAQMPPFIFPHFPRMDWTYWFVPLGGDDGNPLGWFGRLLRGVATRDAAVWQLLDKDAAANLPTPNFVRISPMTYSATLPTAEGAWWQRAAADVAKDPAWVDVSPGDFLAEPRVFSAQELSALAPLAGDAPWPAAPMLRELANGAPERFVWAVLIVAEALRRVVAETVEPAKPSKAKPLEDEGATTTQVSSSAQSRSNPTFAAFTTALANTFKDQQHWVSVKASTEVDGRSAVEAFSLYSHLANHPKWSRWLMAVTEDEDGIKSEWAIRALTWVFRWTSEIKEKIPGSVLSWESTSGIPNAGKAVFTDLPSGCRLELEVSFQAPRLVRRIFASGRVVRFVEGVLARDLARFREVLLSSAVKEQPPVLDRVFSERLGTCSVKLNQEGRIAFELQGFGSSGATEGMLLALAEKMVEMEDIEEFRCLINMQRGSGCSPFAVPHIVRFLRSQGGRISRTAVLGPRPLMALARVIAQVVNQTGVQFFGEVEEAGEWLEEGESSPPELRQ